MPLAIILFALIILFFAIYAANEYIGFISGALFILSGIYVMIYGFGEFSGTYIRSLSFILIGLGILIFIAAAYEAISRTGVSLISRDDDED